MNSAEKFARVAEEASRASDYDAARAVVRGYLSSWHSDVRHLADPRVALQVDTAIAILGAVKGCGALAKSISTAIEKAREARPKIVELEAEAVRLVHFVGEKAPGPVGDLIMPRGFVITPEGIGGPAKADSDDRPLIASRPVYIAAIVRAIEGGEYHADLVWRSPAGTWEVGTYPRRVLSDSRSIVKLAGDGVPVDSGTASGLVRYLSAFERANDEALPIERAASVMGWQGPMGRFGFLWGSTSIGAPGRGVRLIVEGGKQEIADSFSASGSLHAWERLIWDPIQSHPRSVLAVYASIAPVILGIVNAAPGFVVDIAGTSTGGKTTALQVAASVWGDPARLIGSWSDTRASIEHAGSMSCHLPTFLDDTKEARDNPSKVIEVVYQITGTRSKRRATPDGLRRTASFRTVLISTGEMPITSHGTDTGAAARVLPLHGWPLSGPDARSLAEQLKIASLENFGHLGPRVIEWLVANRSSWSIIREGWNATREEFAERAAERVTGRAKAFAGRAAPYVATLHTVAQILARALNYPVNDEALGVLEREAMSGARVAERHLQALRDLFRWLATRSTARDGSEDRVAHEVIYRWDPVSKDGPDVIARSLRRWLQGEGYQLDIIEDWAREGLIVTNGGRRTHPVRFASSGSRPSCYRFTPEAVKIAEA